MAAILICAAIIAIVIAVIGIHVSNTELENIQSVSLVDEIQWTKKQYYNSGFSVGMKGNPRFYYRSKNVPHHVEAKFRVRYKDGKVKTISRNKGTTDYNYLITCIQNQAQQQKKQAEAMQQKRKQDEKNASVISQQTIPETQKINVVAPSKNRKKYLNIPFEVLPNEYAMEVRHQSCAFKSVPYNDAGNERYEVDICCEVHFDPNVKGVTNRRVVVSLYDAQGRITYVMKDWDHLTKSGCRIIDINFWKEINDEPSKVSFSLEKYN